MSNPFDSTIDTYNKHAAKFVQHFEQKLDTQELDEFLATVPAGGKILDAGCGSARDAAYFISKGYQAEGIDLSVGLLNEAKKLHPEVPTQVMSLTDLSSFRDNSFDGVWCKAALLHIQRKQAHRVLEGFHRILDKGGSLFLQTKAGEGQGTQPVPFDSKLERFFTFYTESELTNMLQVAGFKMIEAYGFNGKDRSMGSSAQDWVVLFAERSGKRSKTQELENLFE